MKELLLNLKDIAEEGEEWADSPARAWLESEVLKYTGKIIRVRITLARPHYHKFRYYNTNNPEDGNT